MPSPSILSVHNHYHQPGGEDRVFASEAALLEAKGHRVIRYETDNARVERWGAGSAINAIWSVPSALTIGELVRRHEPDIVHFHNTFPLISPAAYYSVQREGVPVVQTLHNFRLVCPGATLFRDGGVCQQCLEQGSFRPAMANKCYRGSRPATAAVAAMLSIHNAARTWKRKVDVYIALSQFARRKFIAAGLPESRVVVKPNFVRSDHLQSDRPGNGGYALFVGRLAPEKGIATLAEAWKELPDIPLIVAGEGPLSETRWPQGVSWVGRQTPEQVRDLMRHARVLLVPSDCFEMGPLTIIEAFACGLPVIASDLGSMAEAVDHGRTGFLFQPGDAADLARTVRTAFAADDSTWEAMRAAARNEFEQRYTADRNYDLLMDIYRSAIAAKEARAAS
jgi:glycosyltransferase involved in cell wall biosynthesis